MKKIVAFLLLFTFGLSSCEKDDICDPNTPTTPRLVIAFYDNADATIPKKVTNLKVVGINADGTEQTTGIVFNKSITTDAKYLANGTSISIPLKTNEESTTYKFIFNAASTDPTLTNTDVIRFDYTHKDIYVSRACGYKTNFTLNPAVVAPPSQPFIFNPGIDGAWMKVINVEKFNIESENETHIKIYF
ncbi:DUF6452 family protein [uncultured Flavobacterium sp.]|uniref:DUF6452 family protein n=1 Tax=uncultured Flavobacterium sp. TaxID=165435 RepID=UPI002931A68B|nr:DUF6452 family protein [uncultured Flavobacterium sp.]